MPEQLSCWQMIALVVLATLLFVYAIAEDEGWFR